MASETAVAEEEAGAAHLEEAESGQAARSDGRVSKLNRFTKLQTYQQIKEIVTLDEIKLKFMKQGVDVSRSRLISEAIKLLSRAVSEGNFELRG